jgi:hypothetical protein
MCISDQQRVHVPRALKRKNECEFSIKSFIEAGQATRELINKKICERSAEDVFFENCVMRVKKLDPIIRSYVNLQVSCIIFNAENPRAQVNIPELPPNIVPVSDILATAMLASEINKIFNLNYCLKRNIVKKLVVAHVKSYCDKNTVKNKNTINLEVHVPGLSLYLIFLLYLISYCKSFPRANGGG